MLNRILTAFPLLALASLTAILPACASEDEDSDSSNEAISFKLGVDLPWEVSTPQGEKVLPNLFYAEASQNEQVMPTTIGGRNQIDRLVYPTIGNPNLYVKGDSGDAFMTVLRVEHFVLNHLSGTVGDVVTDSKFYPKQVLPPFLRTF